MIIFIEISINPFLGECPR